MKEFIKVVILEGGEQCREVGRLPFPGFTPKFVGDMPKKDYAFIAKLRMYEEQQKQMRVFKMAESDKVPMWECNRCANNNYFISIICETCGNQYEKPEWYKNEKVIFFRWSLRFCDPCRRIREKEALKRLPEIINKLSENL